MTLKSTISEEVGDMFLRNFGWLSTVKPRYISECGFLKLL
jgi:hypothetical protein